jgi:hypothetical protein
VVVSRGNDLFLSPCSLSPPHHQKSYVALHGTTYGTTDVYQCTCSYVHELAQSKLITQTCNGVPLGSIPLRCVHTYMEKDLRFLSSSPSTSFSLSLSPPNYAGKHGGHALSVLMTITPIHVAMSPASTWLGRWRSTAITVVAATPNHLPLLRHPQITTSPTSATPPATVQPPIDLRFDSWRLGFKISWPPMCNNPP